MSQRFIVSHEGQELGPFTEEEIRAKLLANKLYPVDYVFDETAQDWVLINERFSLSPTSPVTPLAATPNAKNMTFPSVHELPPPHDIVVRRTPQIVPTPPIAQPAAKKSPITTPVPASGNPTKNRVHFSGGIGTVSMTQLKAGKVSLRLKDYSTLGLAGTPDVNLVIHAGPINQFIIHGPSACTAGEEFVVEIKAYDAFENFISSYSGELSVELSGSQTETKTASFQKGLARVHFKHTKAENVQIRLRDPRGSNLKMPPNLVLAIHPGQPAKLIVDAPPEAQAGQSVDLKIRAVDAHGNLVTDFKGDIDLAVETQPIGKVS